MLAFLLAANVKSQNAVDKSETLENWDRKYFTKPLNKISVFYVVHGNFSADFKVTPEYRTKGIPEGIELMKYGPKKYPEEVTAMLKGFVWDEMKAKRPELSKQMLDSKECFIIKGELADRSDLNYLRDLVGVITYLLDHGGVSVFDAQSLMFFGKEDWHERIFDPNGAVPRNHIMIFCSDEKGGKWFHTQGMGKFGRPDLSIHNVPPKYEEGVTDMLNRFIEYEAFGAIIPDNKEVKMKNLPPGMRCENKAAKKEPVLNNAFVEINWK